MIISFETLLHSINNLFLIYLTFCLTLKAFPLSFTLKKVHFLVFYLYVVNEVLVSTATYNICYCLPFLRRLHYFIICCF